MKKIHWNFSGCALFNTRTFNNLLMSAAVWSIIGTAAGEEVSAMQPKTPRSLVVMLDGVRSDALLAAETPFIDKLVTQQWHPAYKVFYSYNARPVAGAPTDSAPNHAAIATGVTPAKNLVKANGLTAQGNYEQYPSFLRRITGQTGEKNLFCYLWNEDKFLDKNALTDQLRCDSDEKNFQEMVRVFKSGNTPSSVLWFIDAPDLGGHSSGYYPFGSLYLAAISQCDGFLEEIFRTIAQRNEFANEDWLIIITSDHGGIGRDHGPRTAHTETLPFIVVGKNVPAGYGIGAINNFDCAALVLSHHNFAEIPGDLDAQLPAMSVAQNVCRGPVYHETFDDPSSKGLVGEAEIVYRQGVRNGALQMGGKFNTPLRLGQTAQKKVAPQAFSCSFFLKIDAPAGNGLIWQLGNLKMHCADNKVILTGQKAEQTIKIGEFVYAPQTWQLITITADPTGNVTAGWGAADGFFYFTSAEVELPDSDSKIVFGENWQGQIDELMFFDRAVKISDFSKYWHIFRRGGAYNWQ